MSITFDGVKINHSLLLMNYFTTFDGPIYILLLMNQKKKIKMMKLVVISYQLNLTILFQGEIDIGGHREVYKNLNGWSKKQIE